MSGPALRLDSRIQLAMAHNLGISLSPEEVKHLASMVVVLRKITRGARNAKGLALSALKIAGLE